MEKRRIGDSGIEVAPLALGGNVFGWTADTKTSFDVLDAFVDAGGTMIDTADVYSAWVPGHSGGESEAVIGEWLKRDRSKRAKVVIATKVGFMTGLKPQTISSAWQNRRRRCADESSRTSWRTACGSCWKSSKPPPQRRQKKSGRPGPARCTT